MRTGVFCHFGLLVFDVIRSVLAADISASVGRSVKP